jgi:hypothetical protein
MMGLKRTKLLVGIAGALLVLVAGWRLLPGVFAPWPLIHFSDGSSLRLRAISNGDFSCLSLRARLLLWVARPASHIAFLKKWFAYPSNPGLILWGEFSGRPRTRPMVLLQDGTNGPSYVLECLWAEGTNGWWLGRSGYPVFHGSTLPRAPKLCVTVFDTLAPGQTNLVASLWLPNPRPALRDETPGRAP